MNYYSQPFLSNSYLGEIAKAVHDKHQIDPVVLQKAFAYGSDIDAMLTEPSELDLEGDNLRAALLSHKAVHSVPILSQLLTHRDVKFQHECYGKLEGVNFKAKLDGIVKPLGFLIEIKTTASQSESSFFANGFKNLDYDRQIAVYLDLSKTDTCIMIAITKKEPIKVFHRVFTRASPEYLSGKAKYQKLISIYKKVLMPQNEFNLNYPQTFQPSI
jgi:hypothetical protein